MIFNFRKIASAAASIAMVGSTVALAAAANFPAPFVSGGSHDVALVYGSTAASSDLVAAIDITNTLNAAIGTPSGPVTVTGESYPLFGSGDSQIYLNKSINSVRNTLTKSELPTVLADSEISGNVDAEITHLIKVGSNPVFGYAKQPTSDDDPVWNFPLSTTAASSLFNASVIFDQATNFTHTDTEGETFTMFGDEFTVGTATDATSIVLFRSANKIYLDSASNPSSTITVAGETYTVELVSASDTSATIRLTNSAGESDQDEINEAQSKKILGIEVAVNTADESDALGTISAEVVIGASKVKITSGNEVQFGTDEDSLEGTKATVYSNTATVTQIDFQVAANDSDEDALLIGSEFGDPITNAFKFVFANVANDDDRETFEIENSGDDKMTVSLTDHRENEKTLNWFYNVTTTVNPDAVFANGPKLADDDGHIINVREHAIVNKSDLVMVGNEDDGYLLKLTTLINDSSGIGDDIIFTDQFDTSNQPKLSVSQEGTGTLTVGGQSYTVNYWKDSSNTGFVRINDAESTGNAVNMFNSIETGSGAKAILYQPTRLDLGNYDGAGTDSSSLRIPDGDGYSSITTTAVDSEVWTIGSSNINTSLASGTNSSVTTIGRFTYNVTTTGQSNRTDIYVISPSGANIIQPGLIFLEEQNDLDIYEGMVVTLQGASTGGDGIEVNNIERTSAIGSYTSHHSDTDVSSAVTRWGTIATLDNGPNQQTAMISYPDEQIYAEVYVTEAGATSSGSGSGALGGLTVKDTEVSSVSGKNLIVVGGSCVNTVAASLLGSDVPLCTTAFTQKTGVGSGSFLIQTFDSPFASGQIATLVAGYNAGDTSNAATYLRTQSVDTTVGKKYIGTSGTSATLQTA